MTEHVTAHVDDTRGNYVAGCTCGWVGQYRTTVAVVVADELAHLMAVDNLRQNPLFQHGDECPVCYEHNR